MILGDGDVAAVLPERDDLLFFASGVSNSQETRELEYEREINLLLDQRIDCHIVYFSSLGVLDGSSRYYRHKRDMEVLIKDNFQQYCIVRLGNIDWGTNSHTLINYLKLHPTAELQDAWRYIVDKDEFLYWISKIPAWSVEMNIPGRRMKVQEIYDEYVLEAA